MLKSTQKQCHLMNATTLLAKLQALAVITASYQSTTTRYRFDEFHLTFLGPWPQFCQYQMMLISCQQPQSHQSQLLQKK